MLVTMLDRIKKTLMFAPFLPAVVKELLMDVGSELDRLRAEVNELRSKIERE